MQTINKTWFKNRLKNNELLVRCVGKYSDDYAYDNATNYGKEIDFREVKPNEFDDRDVRLALITGDKKGVIEFSVYTYRYYEFKLKTA